MKKPEGGSKSGLSCPLETHGHSLKRTRFATSQMTRKAYFGEVAEEWDQRFCTPELATFLEKLVPKFGLTLGQIVLDVGTGTGVLIPFLLRAVGPTGSITAIDYSEQMVQICRSKYSHLYNVTVELQDIEHFAPSSSFDAVICFGVFPHLEKKEKALRNMYRTLKPKGIFVIAHALSNDEITMHHRSAAPPVMTDTLPSKDEMKKLLTHTGFTQISITDKPGCYLCLAKKQ